MKQRQSFVYKYKDALLVLFLVCTPLVLYLAHSKAPKDHNLFDRILVTLSAPVQWVVHWTLDTTTSAFQHYVLLVGAQEKNDSLMAENAQLRAQLATHEEHRLENERLRALFGLTERAPDVRMTLARIIAVSPSPLFRSMRIDRGSQHGVAAGEAVIATDGVVGRVAAVAPYFSDVLLLVDSSHSVDVLVQRTRARARLRGTGGEGTEGVRLDLLGRTEDVVPADILVTSGVGTAFPKGIRVGTVLEVEQRAFGLYQQAVVQPSVDLGRVEEVLVIHTAWPRGSDFAQASSEP